MAGATASPTTRLPVLLSVRGSTIAACWITPARVRGQAVIVFLHEALGSMTQWRDFPDGLCAALGLRGFLFDRVGHGQSGALPGPRTKDYLREQAEQWLPEILSLAAIDRPVLFGHSDGGSIALFHAAARPTAALITEAAHVFVEDVTLRGIRELGRTWVGTDLSQRLARHHGDKTEALFRAWHDTWLTPEFARLDMRAILPGIKSPALIMQGDGDQYGSEAQLRAIVAGAQAWIVPGCGHAPHLEQKQKVIARIAGWLGEPDQDLHVRGTVG
jgi:pimeloyl-ACP methyl ester carboxylesterase